MALIQLKTDPTSSDLRQFALIWWPLFCALIAYWLWPGPNGASRASTWFLAAGLAVALLGGLWPFLIRPLFLALLYLTAPIGWLVSHAVMVFVYYAVLTPVGLALRISGRDPLEKKTDPDADTYWVRVSGDRPMKSYFQQY